MITFVNGKWRENCYFVVNQDLDALVIDPGSRVDDICALIEQNHWRIRAIVNTHAHYDHIGAVAGLQERFQVPFYMHGADAPLLKRANLYRMLFEAGEAIRIPPLRTISRRFRKLSRLARSPFPGLRHPVIPRAACA